MSASDGEIARARWRRVPLGRFVPGVFTRNTMALRSEAIGLALPGSGRGTRHPTNRADAYAEASGEFEAVLEIVRRQSRPATSSRGRRSRNAVKIIAAQRLDHWGL